MKRSIRFGIIFTVLAIIISSCLTVEKKIYKFEFTGKNSGKLTITYVNLMSMPDYMGDEEEGETDSSVTDFEDLIDTYLNGTRLETDYPLATNIQKRLYEENGKLNGEVTMEFNNLEAARLYQFDKKSPICFSVGNTIDGESYENSNGTLGNTDFMNVVFWKSGTKNMEVTTTVTTPDEETVSLLPQYRSWKK
jgi:hypothetical protein